MAVDSPGDVPIVPLSSPQRTVMTVGVMAVESFNMITFVEDGKPCGLLGCSFSTAYPMTSGGRAVRDDVTCTRKRRRRRTRLCH